MKLHRKPIFDPNFLSGIVVMQIINVVAIRTVTKSLYECMSCMTQLVYTSVLIQHSTLDFFVAFIIILCVPTHNNIMCYKWKFSAIIKCGGLKVAYSHFACFYTYQRLKSPIWLQYNITLMTPLLNRSNRMCICLFKLYNLH